MPRTETVGSAARVLEVLAWLLEADWYHGVTPGDIAAGCRITPSMATRYVTTLEAAGWIERIPETGRLRVATRMARKTLAVLGSIQAAERRLSELKARIGGHGAALTED